MVSLFKQTNVEFHEELRRKRDTPAKVLNKIHASRRYPVEGPTATVYFLKLVEYQRIFYKIGITANSIENRFKMNKDLCFSVILQSKDIPRGRARLLEKMLHDSLSKKRYVPLKLFDGWTECFVLNEQDIVWVLQVLRAA